MEAPCYACGGPTYRPDNPGTTRRAARRCAGCHHVPGHCTCPFRGGAWLAGV